MRSRVYVTVGCPSVCPSVPLFHLSIATTACRGFAAKRPADRRYRSIACAGAQHCSNNRAAPPQHSARQQNANIVAFFVAVEGWIQTGLWTNLIHPRFSCDCWRCVGYTLETDCQKVSRWSALLPFRHCPFTSTSDCCNSARIVGLTALY